MLKITVYKHSLRVFALLLIAVFIIISLFALQKSDEEVAENVSEPAIKLFGNITSEELAKKLVNDVYRGIEFKNYVGKGSEYIARYVCSNICIDACANGVVRYLCDVTAKSDTDLFYEWLLEQEDAKVVSESRKYGFISRKIEGNNIIADMQINPENNRVFVAQITIKYQVQ